MARLAAASVTVKFSKTWVAQVFRIADPRLAAAAERVAVYQREHIPVGHDAGHGRAPGFAKSRIAVRVRPGKFGGREFEIGSDATTPEGFPYPVVLDVGARPHVIESHGNYPLKDAEGVIYGRHVNHPGVQPTNWCRGSLTAVHGVV
jgi:hypothetical protein